MAVSGRHRLLPHGVAAVATLLVLAPLLAPGYSLSYDMVFVPHQPLRWDLIAPIGGLPRAVPQDAIVSVLSLAMPGWLIQRVALAAIVYLAALGAGLLVPAERRLTRVVAAIGYAWTPFVAERLIMGHWGLLLAYAVMPWLVRAALGVRAGRPGALPRVILAGALSAITPTGGLIALATTAVLAVGRRRGGWLAVAAVAALNAPWLVAVAISEAGGRSDPQGVAAFAARGENLGGALGALLGTGGIWNAQVVPVSRESVLAPLVTLVLLGLAVAGYPVLRRRWSPGDAVRLGILAAASLVLAAAGTWSVTAAILEWAVVHIPGAGLVRDGQKFLLPYALLLAVCVALGAERAAARLATPRGRLVLVAVAVLPLAALPDLAFGAAGRLRPVSYPADWDRVAAAVAADPGDVLSLPFSEYRSYSWSGGRPMIDPALRYFQGDVLIDDTLRVGNLAVEGESPRAAEVRAILDAGRPVAETGVRWVLVQREAGADVPAAVLAGLRPVYRGAALDLYANPVSRPAPTPDPWRLWVPAAADLAVLAMVIAAGWNLLRRPTAW